jgi:DNA-binding transcriptional MerR regulator
MNQIASADPSGRRLVKAPDAFRTISEVAEELNVPQHVLRFWETKFGQIKPLKRGGGRRYYRPEDIDLLRRIRSLLYSKGHTIKGVQKVLREGGRTVVDARPAPPPPKPLEPKPAPPAEAVAKSTALATNHRNALEKALTDLTEIRSLLRDLGH